jgi:CRP/FNR family transcriptional regulator, anaerobic regulatory protein
MDEASLQRFTAAFPDLAGLDADARRLLDRAAQAVNVPKGTVVFRPGDACRSYLMMLDGSVRVQMTAESGREIVLYRVTKGETCILTTSCLMTRRDYGAEGVTEADCAALALDAGSFHELLGRSDVFRDFVFRSFGTRITGLLALVEEVAFRRVDLRLARFLLDRAPAGGEVELTHQTIAVELGTAREVVSRQLKEFERRGLVALTRGRVVVTDAVGLAGLEAEV